MQQGTHRVLPSLSQGYPRLGGKLLTRSSPVCRYGSSRFGLTASASLTIARLACLIHAASVHSEPGSNSPNKILEYVCIKALNDSFHIILKRPYKSLAGLTGPRLAIQLSKNKLSSLRLGRIRTLA